MNDELSSTPNAKPGRPLGLSLAILASLLLFVVMPAIQLGFDVVVQLRLNDVMTSPIPDGQGGEIAPVLAGSSADLVPPLRLAIELTQIIGFSVIAFFAWRGRPPWIRLVMFSAVLLLTLLNVTALLINLVQTASLAQGLTSSDSLFDTLRGGEIIVSVLLALYVVWYMNRAPSRAFYRGHYLDREQSPTA